MNDLPMATKFKVNFFADDTNLIMSDYKANTLESRVNMELENIDKWMRQNKFSVNFQKTKYMIITKRKENYEI